MGAILGAEQGLVFGRGLRFPIIVGELAERHGEDFVHRPGKAGDMGVPDLGRLLTRRVLGFGGGALLGGTGGGGGDVIVARLDRKDRAHRPQRAGVIALDPAALVAVIGHRRDIASSPEAIAEQLDRAALELR